MSFTCHFEPSPIHWFRLSWTIAQSYPEGKQIHSAYHWLCNTLSWSSSPNKYWDSNLCRCTADVYVSRGVCVLIHLIFRNLFPFQEDASNLPSDRGRLHQAVKGKDKQDSGPGENNQALLWKRRHCLASTERRRQGKTQVNLRGREGRTQINPRGGPNQSLSFPRTTEMLELCSWSTSRFSPTSPK